MTFTRWRYPRRTHSTVGIPSADEDGGGFADDRRHVKTLFASSNSQVELKIGTFWIVICSYRLKMRTMWVSGVFIGSNDYYKHAKSWTEESAFILPPFCAWDIVPCDIAMGHWKNSPTLVTVLNQSILGWGTIYQSWNNHFRICTTNAFLLSRIYF